MGKLTVRLSSGRYSRSMDLQQRSDKVDEPTEHWDCWELECNGLSTDDRKQKWPAQPKEWRYEMKYKGWGGGGGVGRGE